MTYVVQKAADKLHKLQKENAELKRQLEKLAEALEYYGDKKSWRRRTYSDVARDIVAEDCEEIVGYAEYCGGKRARAALKEYRGE